MARFAFGLRMLYQRFDKQRSHCPYCHSRFFDWRQRKWLLIEARKCSHCALIYRWPTELSGSTRDFYESDYDGQQATNLPSADEVDTLRAANFKNSPYDKTNREEFLLTVFPKKGNLLDYGCSFGYAAHQFREKGFSVSGYELDRGRAAFGTEHLGVKVSSDEADLQGQQFDIIYADHSYEHVDEPGRVLDLWSDLSHAGTRLVIFVPSGSGLEGRSLGMKWGPYLGEAHNFAFTMAWFRDNLPRHGWIPRFYHPDGKPLSNHEYLDDHWEIAMIADRVD